MPKTIGSKGFSLTERLHDCRAGSGECQQTRPSAHLRPRRRPADALYRHNRVGSRAQPLGGGTEGEERTGSELHNGGSRERRARISRRGDLRRPRRATRGLQRAAEGVTLRPRTADGLPAVGRQPWIEAGRRTASRAAISSAACDRRPASIHGRATRGPAAPRGPETTSVSGTPMPRRVSATLGGRPVATLREIRLRALGSLAFRTRR
jgi:hypothetical protein